MSRRSKIILTIVIVILLAVVAFLVWSKVIAPNREISQTPTPTPTPIETPTPTPAPAATQGTLAVHADVAKLHITKIIIYRNGEATEAKLDGNGDLRMDLLPGNYEIDYEASPDLYPHKPEAFIIVAGVTHQVDFLMEN